MKNYSQTLKIKKINEFKNKEPKHISSFAIHQESLKGK
jgi:hypothetical protein